ncbi:Wadjet anti-phage system protein JetD domain-containing protein [Kribbella sp. NPDC058693]|uniref:Wadjet anti-phage system protein JetD domain-containing protein n=1 Tax=Kribbella sp. NPDC058693 TaxID=3346602 RepID=UPI0036672618
MNTWLRDHCKEQDVLPLRERSLQIFKHEKELDRLLSTGVFGPGRLTLELLRTFRTHPPLPSVRIGNGPVLLVVENDNTFNSIRSTLATNPGPVGHLAWGAGGAFEASVRSCGELAGITRIRYFGDLDVDGLRIPRNAATTAAEGALPSLLPANGLYRRLLRTESEQPGQRPALSDEASSLTSWIPDSSLRADIVDLLGRGVRIPQEALNASLLQADRSWIHDL